MDDEVFLVCRPSSGWGWDESITIIEPCAIYRTEEGAIEYAKSTLASRNGYVNIRFMEGGRPDCGSLVIVAVLLGSDFDLDVSEDIGNYRMIGWLEGEYPSLRPETITRQIVYVMEPE